MGSSSKPKSAGAARSKRRRSKSKARDNLSNTSEVNRKDLVEITPRTTDSKGYSGNAEASAIESIAALRTTAPSESLDSFDSRNHLPRFLVGLLILLPVMVWAYFPTLVWMEQQWRNEPDYSHGYIVLPLAALIAYYRRDSFPGVRTRVSWAGVSLIVLALVMRFFGRLGYMDFMDGWSLLPWTAGVTWILVGPAAFRWALPSIFFLLLLVPLPYQAESMLSLRLQGFATNISTIMLRILGQPAVSEGHTIWLGDNRLLVEEACSGLRIFVGIGALAFFWASIVRRSWLDKIVILLAALPLAVLVNSLRVTAIAFLAPRFENLSMEQIHDWAGIAMIFVAAILLWAVKAYWQNLYYPVQKLTARHTLVGETS